MLGFSKCVWIRKSDLNDYLNNDNSFYLACYLYLTNKGYSVVDGHIVYLRQTKKSYLVSFIFN